MATKKFLYDIGTKGAKRAEKQLKGVDKATKAMVGSAAKLAIGFISIAAAVKGLQFAFASAKLAAQAQNVERAFGKLAEQAGTNADIMIKKMREATAETISDFQLMQQFNTAAMLGLPLDQFDKMIEIARGAAQAMGTSMQFMLQSIVTGIGRQSKLMLDNLGILISAESANKKYALAMGIVGRQLTDIERKQAFANEAVRVGLKNLEAAGGIVESNADAYERAVAGLENLKIAFGKLVNPATVFLLNNFTTGYSALIRVLSGDQGSVAEKAAINIDNITRAIDALVSGEGGGTKWLKLLEDTNIELNLNASLSEKLAVLYDAQAAALTVLMDAQSAENLEALTKWAEAGERVAEATFKSADALSIYNPILSETQTALDAINPSMQWMFDSINGIARGFIDATLNAQKFGDAVVSALKAIAAEILAQAAIFALAKLLGIPIGQVSGVNPISVGLGRVFGVGDLGISHPSGSVQSGGNQTTVVFQNAVIIGTDQRAVEDQLMPMINQAIANA